MSIYPTKTRKLNKRDNNLRTGIILTSVFSIILLFLCFDFIHIFTITILGTFGLISYPVCILFIVLGIFKILDKDIRTSKSVVILLICWLIIFTLILQLATSNNLDSTFGEYIAYTFKSYSTAGGVILGLFAYPLHYITYDVASYIILSIILVIITSVIIDKLYNEFKNKKLLKMINTPESFDEIIDNSEIAEDTDDEMSYSANPSFKDIPREEDIFISDEDENENREEARRILGFSREDNILESKESYIEKLESKFDNSEEDVIRTDNKPNIFVHDEDDLSPANNLKPKTVEESNKEQVDINDERRKAALAYLNISNGKFDVKNSKTNSDNESNQIENKKSNVSSFDNQNKNNLDRLNSIDARLKILNNNFNEMQTGVNPFKQREQTQIDDLFDENLTKESFSNNKDKFSNNNVQLGNPFSNMTKLAQEKYSGDVKENIVDANGFRPVQVSMNDPVTNRSKSTTKLYKKPPKYNKPPIDLLKKYSTNIESDDEYIREKGNKIVETLKAFRIDTKIINAIKGPTFTRFELQMAPGISVNSINSKVNDLSMVLESTCRVQVPIPGKNAFGIEVPNKKRMTVGLREMLESSNFQNSKSPLTFALGKDISADCKVACIDKLVHTLVAGSTGSGKSVCLNTMLVSLLYKASPEDLRILLVDPKTVEFSMFNGLPHMLIPNTITECEKAVSALNWLVEEMERRYKKLNSLGVKKISEYNETPEVIGGTVPKMFYIVMIFDEVGDFMNRAKKEIEEKILLLAAKSRACGIHLVLATQRPTVDVITGTIKANLPSRIAFAVNSYNDSKTILESSGAEYLLGMGDMLFLPQGSNDMDRIQGCFIDNNELKAIINYIKDNNEAEFDEEIEDQMFNKNEGFDPTNGAEEAFDPMLKDCLRYFIKAKKASSSSLQAYFGIGYPKANKIVLQMEKAGFVSPGDSNGRRTLYITPQEFEERFGEDLDE